MDATHDSTFPPRIEFDADDWATAIFAERFLYPLLNSGEAAAFRAVGQVLFFRFLEYSGLVTHGGESRIASDLRGAVRDLRLVARFVQAIGESFDAEDLQPDDVPPVTLSAQLYPAIDDIARQLEEALPPEGR